MEIRVLQDGADYLIQMKNSNGFWEGAFHPETAIHYAKGLDLQYSKDKDSENIIWTNDEPTSKD